MPASLVALSLQSSEKNVIVRSERIVYLHKSSFNYWSDSEAVIKLQKFIVYVKGGVKFISALEKVFLSPPQRDGGHIRKSQTPRQ